MNAATTKSTPRAAKGRPNMADATIGPVAAPVEVQTVPAVLTAAEKKSARAAAKIAKSDKAVRDMVVDHSASNKAIAALLNAEQTEVMAKSLDIPEADVQNHVEVVTGYQGPMRALRDRVKAGKYTKAANGQPSCGDEVANALGALEPTEVIAACMVAMDIANPYLTLNIGQQSMNLRNKLRGQLKRGEIGMGVLREAIEVVMEGRTPVKAPEAAPIPEPKAPKAKRAPKSK